MRLGRAVPRAVPCPKLRDESGGQQGCAESANAANKQAQKTTGKLLSAGKGLAGMGSRAGAAAGRAGGGGDLSCSIPLAFPVPVCQRWDCTVHLCSSTGTRKGTGIMIQPSPPDPRLSQHTAPCPGAGCCKVGIAVGSGQGTGTQVPPQLGGMPAEASPCCGHMPAPGGFYC